MELPTELTVLILSYLPKLILIKYLASSNKCKWYSSFFKFSNKLIIDRSNPSQLMLNKYHKIEMTHQTINFPHKCLGIAIYNIDLNDAIIPSTIEKFVLFDITKNKNSFDFDIFKDKIPRCLKHFEFIGSLTFETHCMNQVMRLLKKHMPQFLEVLIIWAYSSNIHHLNLPDSLRKLDTRSAKIMLYTYWPENLQTINVDDLICNYPMVKRLKCWRFVGSTLPNTIKTLCIKNLTSEIPSVTKLIINISLLNKVKLQTLRKLTVFCSGDKSNNDILRTAIDKIHCVKILNYEKFGDSLIEIDCSVSKIQWVDGIINMLDCYCKKDITFTFPCKKLIIVGDASMIVFPDGLEELRICGFFDTAFYNLPKAFFKLDYSNGPVINVPAELLII